MARDGAAYDPATDSWRPIADAPVDVGYWYRPAFVGGELVLFGDNRWWAYDPAVDAAPPARTTPAGQDTGDLATSEDGFVYALSRSGALWALNVVREEWARVPQGSPDGFRRTPSSRRRLSPSPACGRASPTVPWWWTSVPGTAR